MTLDLSSDLYQIATESFYNGSLPEAGKTNIAHTDVKEWHYFVTNLVYVGDSGKSIDCHMSIDVKENASGDYFYSFAIEKGTVPQTLLAVVTENSATVPNTNVPQNSDSVNNNSRQSKHRQP